MLVVFGLGLSDLTRPSGYVGGGVFFTIYTSYLLLKKLNSSDKVKKFFN